MSSNFLTGRQALEGVASENARLDRGLKFWRRVWRVSALVAVAAFGAAVALVVSGRVAIDSPTAELALAVAAAAAAAGLASLLRWRASNRTSGALGHWTNYLRSRRQFYDRLSIECERSADEGRPFAVLFIRLLGPQRDEAASLRTVERALAVVESGPRHDDLSVAISPNEIAVLSLHVRQHEAPWLAERLKTAALAAVARDGVDVRVGWAAWSAKTSTPDLLIDRVATTLEEPEQPRNRLLRAA